MDNFMHKEASEVKDKVIKLCRYTLESLKLSYDAFTNFDKKIAKQVIKRDEYVNEQEVEIEEEVIRQLSLYQPVASDLRLTISTLKINHDLERLHDSIVNICQGIRALKKYDVGEFLQNFQTLLQNSINILKQTIQAFEKVDGKLALKICKNRKVIKEQKNDIFSTIEESLLNDDNEDSEIYIHMSFILQNSYRINKYITKIAEHIYYLDEGVIIRHTHHDLQLDLSEK